MDYQALLEQIHDQLRPVIGQGQVANYIPELAGVSPQHFGMAVVQLDGTVHAVGDARVPFSIQSISKLFTLVMALQCEGDALWQRVGREPSGNPFNSLVQLERESGIPRNPFINAGALVLADVLCTRYAVPETAVVDLTRKLAGHEDIHYNRRVAKSERDTAHRNAAMAYFIKSFGNLRNPVPQVLDAYCRHCAIEMNCVDLARAVTLLAHHGVLPRTGERLLSLGAAKRINALMLTCGTYDAAGDFAFSVGLPAKSGVGGGIVALVPGECGVCVWSPGLAPSGNSLAGSLALEHFTTLTGRSIF
ncbi:glutaminase [Aquabacterium sp.]|uniref:glutaminase n=1 Tax=Aquabacterium sp. TaxID=1872578 RepID=UPI002C20E45D|nr:glutaminase [Aquabacterium sp.]HSW04196.1 glutaminase [Aquabacterium sp.]